MHSHALDALRVQQLNKAIKAQLLPRGTNSALRSSPNFPDPPAPLKTKLVDVNKNHAENRSKSQRICTGVVNTTPTLFKKQLFLRAKHNQSISGQSETVEQHMSMTKPVNHRYPQPEKAHDYADDWTRENHAHPPKTDTGYLKSLREALDRTG